MSGSARLRREALAGERRVASTSAPGSATRRFTEHERRLLLAERGIGPQVLERLEQEGFHSLAQLRDTGVVRAVMSVCSTIDSIAWANRRRALERALARGLDPQ